MHEPYMSHSLVRTSPFYTSPFCRLPEKVTFESLFGSTSYFQGYFGEDPESHFLVTFELLWIFQGFGGSRGYALSQFSVWNFRSRFEIFILAWKCQSQALFFFFCAQREAPNEKEPFSIEKFLSVLKAWFFQYCLSRLNFFNPGAIWVRGPPTHGVPKPPQQGK